MPNISQTATNQPLTNQSLAYNNKQLGFIHMDIAPVVNVIKDSAHMTPIDNPQELIKIQRHFLKEVGL